MRRAFQSVVFTTTLIGAAMLGSPALHAAGYTFTTIDHPSAPGATSVFGINNLGQIVGSYRSPLGTPMAGPVGQLVPSPNTRGFLLVNGTFTAINAPNETDTEARGINDSGTIVGRTGSFSFGITFGFVDAGGTFTIVDPQNSSDASLSGIDNVGLMVGSFFDSSFNGHALFTFSPSGPYNTLDFPGGATSSSLTGVNNFGAVTGTYFVNSTIFSYISIGGQFAHTGDNVQINAINDQFAFAGAYFINNIAHGFVFANGNLTAIDVPGASSTIVYGINNAGTLVGTFTDVTGSHGFMATAQ